MESSKKSLHLRLPKIDSIPNMRLLCTRSNVSNRSGDDSASSAASHAGVYRSSRPDHIISTELDQFRMLGIRCIIDFRSVDEYLSSSGHRPLDEEYTLCKALVPKRNYKPREDVKFEVISCSKQKDAKCGSEVDSPSLLDKNVTDPNKIKEEKRHFLINFFPMKHIFTVLNRLPWGLWCLGILNILLDFIMGNNYKNFKHFFITKVLNKHGLKQQYNDIIELSQPSICTALKLLANPDNLPALINCAYGKDRTGIISALILTCLGMPKEYVAEEYALSTAGLEPIQDVLYQEIVEKYKFNEEFLRSEADTMRELLTYIETKYGSVEDYMAAIGFSKDEQALLKFGLRAFEY